MDLDWSAGKSKKDHWWIADDLSLFEVHVDICLFVCLSENSVASSLVFHLHVYSLSAHHVSTKLNTVYSDHHASL